MNTQISSHGYIEVSITARVPCNSHQDVLLLHSRDLYICHFRGGSKNNFPGCIMGWCTIPRSQICRLLQGRRKGKLVGKLL